MSLKLALVSMYAAVSWGCSMSPCGDHHGHHAGGSICADNGVSGTCASDADCATGERCASDSACVAAGGPRACTRDAQCPQDSWCDVARGLCEQGSPCGNESDCEDGFNCDPTRGVCLPAAAPTCAELDSEAKCVPRSDCAPVYAGVDCSCGAGCSCAGGAQGCVCQEFEFFRCVDATTTSTKR